LPNVELRLTDIVQVDAQAARINLHVIFSEHVAVRDIEENFLARLMFTSSGQPGGYDDKRALTVANLEEFGARLKSEHPPFIRSDLEVGATQAVVSHTEITKVLLENGAFTNRYLLAVAADEDLSRIAWDGQAHNTRKLLIQKSHMLFSSNPGTRAFALGERHDSPAAFEAEFKRRKPCVHGSDAHSENDLFVFPEGRQLWVRADPTFNGLVQLTHEPDDRVYLGEEPPTLQRVRTSATKSIDDVAFKRIGKADENANWFSGSVPLNSGLVAVIGKKGSGKSALADVIGLLGNAATQNEFSFLSDSRFLNPKHRLGQQFEATLTWRSGEVESRRLDADPDSDQPERVKHIPQNYLERICAEIQESSARTLFDTELESVIFSHIPPADRLGRVSLEELFGHTMEETEARITLLRQKLAQVNSEYVDLRRRNSGEARAKLQAELEQRRGELEAHRKAQPIEVVSPAKNVSTPEAAAAENELASVVAHIEKLDQDAEKLRAREERAKRRKVAADRILSRINNLLTTVNDFYAQSTDDAGLLEVEPGELVSLTTNTAQLEALRDGIEREIDKITAALDQSREGTTAHGRTTAAKRADALRERLAEPQRRHQEYLRALANWRTQEKKLEGSEGVPGSVKGLEARVAELQQLPIRAEQKRSERDGLMRQIFAAKSELLDSYREFYAPVQTFMQELDVAPEVRALSFDAILEPGNAEGSVPISPPSHDRKPRRSSDWSCWAAWSVLPSASSAAAWPASGTLIGSGAMNWRLAWKWLFASGTASRRK
jgi:hypothetical protein